MEPSPNFLTALATYFSYAVLIVAGRIRDVFRGARAAGATPTLAPLFAGEDDFYTRRLYNRIQDCWNRPIASAPDAHIDVVMRGRDAPEGPMVRSGGTKRCLNLGSYNYLGFAASDPYCTARVEETLRTHGASTCAGVLDAGTTAVHAELESEVARFVGKEAALVFGMGYATNSLSLPVLMAGKGSLIVSDSLNHASIVSGARGSDAKVRVFQHNNPASLEKVLREAISEGQPRTRRPWDKILVVVEGIYSMEGEVVRLKEIVEVKKRYRAYLYLDEAHSIGALGATGRGACEHCGVDPADVDVMMGTFTKSFGSCGGYIAGDAGLVQHVRWSSPGTLYATSMAPPAAQQTLSALHVLQGMDGTDRGARKLRELKENSNWFRGELRALGLEVIGDDDSPVMPVMLYNPAKIAAFSRECFKRNVAVVVVGFPATPLLLSRTRVCISAAHTRADLEQALAVFREVAHDIGIVYRRPSPATAAA